MLRLIGGILAGIVVFVVAASILFLALRHAWPDYAVAEKAMKFTLPMMAARLAVSGLGSLAGGLIAALIDRGGRAALLSGVLLLLFFAPFHYSIWNQWPVWYHLTFLASLPLLGWLGGRFARRRAL